MPAKNTATAEIAAGVWSSVFWVSSVLLPQATRLSAMTSASSREINFFMLVVLSWCFFVLSYRNIFSRITVFKSMCPAGHMTAYLPKEQMG